MDESSSSSAIVTASTPNGMSVNPFYSSGVIDSEKLKELRAEISVVVSSIDTPESQSFEADMV